VFALWFLAIYQEPLTRLYALAKRDTKKGKMKSGPSAIRTHGPRHVKAFLSENENNNAIDDENNSVGARAFKSPPAQPNWQQFHNFLLQRMTATTAADRLRYARQYAPVLEGKLGIPNLLQLPPNKRIHIMKSLSCLARFTGSTEQWQQIRKQYQLSWSTGTEKIDAFTRFFSNDVTLDTMIQWLREAVQVLPSKYANLLLFCTLTGMRGSEVVEAVRLMADEDNTYRVYYNPEQQCLQHYLFPQLFIRRTKAIYISIVNEQIIGIAQNIGQAPPNGLEKGN